MKARTLCVLAMLAIALLAQADRPATDVARLSELAESFRAQAQAARTPEYWEMWERMRAIHGPDSDIEVMGIDERGMPFVCKANNLAAAATIRSDELWPGGGSGFNLTGGTLPGNALAMWDAGGVLTGHQEFGGRVLQQDVPSGTSNHSTHVAGTLVASGVDANAKGMAHAATLDAYEWTDDASEMAAEAASGLWVSNHSYGYIHGWEYNFLGDDKFCWFGDVGVSTSEDYLFGFYTPAWWAGFGSTITCEGWDQIAVAAPYYTIVKSAGNDRNDYGPNPPDDGHWYWSGTWTWSTDVRPADGGASGYDTITDAGNAKNVLLVGSAFDIPGGYTGPGDVTINNYSNWGPTDDGRIKPDLLGNGDNLYSSSHSHTTAYTIMGGTSMASPNVAGSVALLYELYNNAAGMPPLSSTMRGLLIHTADEAGPADGPDYMGGWGLANIRAAADLIDIDTRAVDSIREGQLANGETKLYTFHSAGSEPLMVTLAWTDLPGTSPTTAVDPTDLMLVNDLDLRVIQGGNTWRPWRLDPANPSFPATRGDNFRDNVEKVEEASPAAGEVTIQITHKGTLAAPQAFSLIFTGFDGTPVAVSDFCLEGSPGRVDLSWESPRARAEELRLSNEGAGRTWTVPIRELLDGRFEASDLNPILAEGGRFQYRLEQLEGEAWTLLRSESILLDALASRTQLFEPWPNPLSSSTNLRFSLSDAGPVRLSIYDLRGRLVETLAEGHSSAGPQALAWEPGELPAGVYFLTLEAQGERLTRKMLLLR